MKRLTMIGIVSLITGLALFALALGTAEAGGPKVLVGPTPWKGQTRQFHQQRPHVTDTPPASVTLPRHAFPVQPRPPIFVPGFPNRPSYPFLSYGYGCCVYSAPTYGTWVPGYWAYQWVPQSASSSTWMPGYYDADGVWVAGYYSSQTVQGGSYQPYWVPGYWSP
ncbi:MAG TPA: hypothetical protein VFX14_08195 [Methylomirabilota bacterium]|nr:hypothetical protein [Methylomirabilota bacterium]